MDKKVIEELFAQVSKHFDKIPENAKPFFTMFIEETLAYRDELASEEKEPLTVEDVQIGLDLFEEFLSVGTLPAEKMNKKVEVLLKRWIVRINENAS